MMTKRKKRNLEREINSRLYNNLAREGIELRHLDPTRLGNWPLFEYQESDSDYINLLPPSYRNPFPASETSSTTRLTGRIHATDDQNTTSIFDNNRKHIPNEWSTKLYTNGLTHAKSSVNRMRQYLIVLAGLLITGLLLFI